MNFLFNRTLKLLFLPVWQWVLSLPYSLHYRLAYDSDLVREILHIFVPTAFGSLGLRAGFAAANRQARRGTV